MIPVTNDIALVSKQGSVDFATESGDFSIVGDQGSSRSESDSALKALKDDILIRLITSPGEWLVTPDMGAGLREMTGTPMTAPNLARIREKMFRSLTRDLRIPVGDLDVTLTQRSTTSVSISIIVSVAGEPEDLSPDLILDFKAGLREISYEATDAPAGS